MCFESVFVCGFMWSIRVRRVTTDSKGMALIQVLVDAFICTNESQRSGASELGHRAS